MRKKVYLFVTFSRLNHWTDDSEVLKFSIYIVSYTETDIGYYSSRKKVLLPDKTKVTFIIMIIDDATCTYDPNWVSNSQWTLAKSWAKASMIYLLRKYNFLRKPVIKFPIPLLLFVLFTSSLYEYSMWQWHAM